MAEVPQEHRKVGEQGVAQLGGQSTSVWGLRAEEEHRLGLLVWLGCLLGWRAAKKVMSSTHSFKGRGDQGRSAWQARSWLCGV